MVETAEITPQINAVIQRALAPDPADRYASARDFFADLRGLASGGTVPTLPNTIAILDLQNPSADVAEDWIGQGISNRVDQGLARIDSLQVVPQKRLNRAIAVRGTDDPISLGLSLGCRWVVTGAFHRNGTGVRVEARLVEVRMRSSTRRRKPSSPPATRCDSPGALRRSRGLLVELCGTIASEVGPPFELRATTG